MNLFIPRIRLQPVTWENTHKVFHFTTHADIYIYIYIYIYLSVLLRSRPYFKACSLSKPQLPSTVLVDTYTHLQSNASTRACGFQPQIFQSNACCILWGRERVMVAISFTEIFKLCLFVCTELCGFCASKFWPICDLIYFFACHQLSHLR
jgi:hypothetical protein